MVGVVSRTGAQKRRVPTILDADELHYMPPHVWAPIQPPAEGAAEVALELRETESNGTALVAFSSPEALAAGCGPDQPCVQIPADELVQMRRIVGFQCVLLDVGLPEAALPSGELPELMPERAGMLYVPSRPHRRGSNSHADLELGEAESGDVVLLAYTSKQQLLACCGVRQPWVAIDAESISDVCWQAGADLVVFDQPLRD
jgi:hypothetical protein